MAHAIVRLDKLQAVYAGNLESVDIEKDLDNGSHVVVGGLAGMGGEVVVGSAPADVENEEVLLVATPELMYDERLDLEDFYNPVGVPARAYHYTIGDIVTITDDGIDGATVVGEYVVPQNGSERLVASDERGTTRFAGLVIAKENLHGKPATVYRVVGC